MADTGEEKFYTETVNPSCDLTMNLSAPTKAYEIKTVHEGITQAARNLKIPEALWPACVKAAAKMCENPQNLPSWCETVERNNKGEAYVQLALNKEIPVKDLQKLYSNMQELILEAQTQQCKVENVDYEAIDTVLTAVNDRYSLKRQENDLTQFRDVDNFQCKLSDGSVTYDGRKSPEKVTVSLLCEKGQYSLILEDRSGEILANSNFQPVDKEELDQETKKLLTEAKEVLKYNDENPPMTLEDAKTIIKQLDEVYGGVYGFDESKLEIKSGSFDYLLSSFKVKEKPVTVYLHCDHGQFSLLAKSNDQTVKTLNLGDESGLYRSDLNQTVENFKQSFIEQPKPISRSVAKTQTSNPASQNALRSSTIETTREEQNKNMETWIARTKEVLASKGYGDIEISENVTRELERLLRSEVDSKGFIAVKATFGEWKIQNKVTQEVYPVYLYFTVNAVDNSDPQSPLSFAMYPMTLETRPGSMFGTNTTRNLIFATNHALTRSSGARTQVDLFSRKDSADIRSSVDELTQLLSSSIAGLDKKYDIYRGVTK